MNDIYLGIDLANDGGCVIGADAAHSGGVTLHDNESTVSYKFSQVIFAVFFDVVWFALAIRIFAPETS